jgi:ABC-2 type transport system ATP-binding protein
MAHNSTQRLALTAETTPQMVLQELVGRGVTLEKFEIATPTLDEIFVRVVRDELEQE